MNCPYCLLIWNKLQELALSYGSSRANPSSRLLQLSSSPSSNPWKARDRARLSLPPSPPGHSRWFFHCCHSLVACGRHALVTSACHCRRNNIWLATCYAVALSLYGYLRYKVSGHNTEIRDNLVFSEASRGGCHHCTKGLAYFLGFYPKKTSQCLRRFFKVNSESTVQISILFRCNRGALSVVEWSTD